jgi:hypothetical protein
MKKEYVEDNIFSSNIINKEDYILINQIDKITGTPHKVIIDKNILDILRKMDIKD